MVLQQKGKVVWALQPFSQTEILQQSPAWWSPGPLGSHNNYPPGDLLVLWVHTTITRLVSPGPLGSHNNHPPGDLLVLWVHTAITRLVISWSFMFTQQSPAWWSPGPSGSHSTHPPRDLLFLWVHTTINYLVISWSFGFTQQSPTWWFSGPFSSHNNHPPADLLVLWVHTTITVSLPGNISFTTFLKWSSSRKERLCGLCNHFHKQILQQSPAWWSPGPLGSHNSHAPADILVLWVHTTITCLVPWVHTTITCLVISRSSGFTQQSPSWWSPGPSGSHNNHPPGNL